MTKSSQQARLSRNLAAMFVSLGAALIAFGPSTRAEAAAWVLQKAYVEDNSEKRSGDCTHNGSAVAPNGDGSATIADTLTPCYGNPAFTLTANVAWDVLPKAVAPNAKINVKMTVKAISGKAGADSRYMSWANMAIGAQHWGDLTFETDFSKATVFSQSTVWTIPFPALGTNFDVQYSMAMGQAGLTFHHVYAYQADATANAPTATPSMPTGTTTTPGANGVANATPAPTVSPPPKSPPSSGGSPTGSTPPPTPNGSATTPTVGSTTITSGASKSCPDNPAAMELQVCHIVAKPGAAIDAPIYLLKSVDLGALNFELDFDPAVVKVVGNPTYGPAVNLTSAYAGYSDKPGRLRLGWAAKSAVPVSGVWGTVHFQVVGAPGSHTPLDLKVTTATSGKGAPENFLIASGDLVVEAPPPAFTALDADRALAMSVGMMPQDLKYDVDKDGQVTANDARLILQQVVAQ